MPTLVYKRTHNGDPDKDSGDFGCYNCMGRVRSLPFNSVIGVGGQGDEAEEHDIARKLTWIGIDRHDRYVRGWDDPIVTFDHFLYFGPEGDLLEDLDCPHLVKRLYTKKARFILYKVNKWELAEIEKLLALAADAPPSQALVKNLALKKRVLCPPRKC